MQNKQIMQIMRNMQNMQNIQNMQDMQIVQNMEMEHTRIPGEQLGILCSALCAVL